MKKFLISVSLLITASLAVSAPDLQSVMAEEAKKYGTILIRNDANVSYEVKRVDIGNHLLCLSLDFKKAGVISITNSMFPSKESTVLVRCLDGAFRFTRGYV